MVSAIGESINNSGVVDEEKLKDAIKVDNPDLTEEQIDSTVKLIKDLITSVRVEGEARLRHLTASYSNTDAKTGAGVTVDCTVMVVGTWKSVFLGLAKNSPKWKVLGICRLNCTKGKVGKEECRCPCGNGTFQIKGHGENSNADLKVLGTKGDWIE